MRYTILIAETEADFAARTNPAEAAEYWAAPMNYLKALQEAGIFAGGAGLQPPSTATTIRLENGRKTIHDGPYADSREQLGGFFIIEVPNLDVALEWAHRFAQRPGVMVEVRPCLPEPER